MLSAACPATVRFLPFTAHAAVVIGSTEDPFMHDDTSISFRRALPMLALSTLLAYLQVMSNLHGLNRARACTHLKLSISCL